MADEALIEAVRQHQELYDPRHPNYMKAKVKEKTWNDIARKLRFRNGEAAKNTWLKLRGSFRDARRRQKKLVKSGTATDQIKPWKFQKLMSFLQPYMQGALCEGNVSNSDHELDLLNQPTSKNFENDAVDSSHERDECLPMCLGESIPTVDENRNNAQQSHIDSEDKFIQKRKKVNDDFCDILLQQSVQQPEERVQQGSSLMCLGGNIPSVDENRNNVEQSHTDSQERFMQKRKKFNNDLCDLLQRSIQQQEERVQRVTINTTPSPPPKILLEQKNTSNDPLYNFFTSMYQFTKKMPFNYQHRVRVQVFQAVSDAEAAIINMSSEQSSSHNSNQSNIAPPETYESSNQMQDLSSDTHILVPILQND